MPRPGSGARVVFIGCFGAAPRGDWIVSHLEQEGVDTRYVVRDPTVETGVVIIWMMARQATTAVMEPNWIGF